MDIKELKRKAKHLEPIIRIGKNGLTENTISHIKTTLNKKKLIKIKMLGGFLEGNNKKEAAKSISEQTDSILVEQVGFIIVLTKKEQKKE